MGWFQDSDVYEVVFGRGEDQSGRGFDCWIWESADVLADGDAWGHVVIHWNDGMKIGDV